MPDMSLIINGELTIDPSRRDDLIKAAVTMQEASNREDGCLHYVFTADLVRPDVFHIAEKWTSQKALDDHFATPHMADFGRAIAGAVKGIEVLKYEVASEGPVR